MNKTEFAPGMRVIIRDEEWIIKKVEKNELNNERLYCLGTTPLVKDKEKIFLTDLEDSIMYVEPEKVNLVADDSSNFAKSRIYIESQLRQKIPTDNKIHIGHKAAMDSMPYQLEPAQLALSGIRARIMVADAVGIGKTMEAGIAISELIARGKGKRILVVTVKSMMTQFQKEMWNRFTIPLVRLDSNKIARIRSELPSNYNPFFYYDKTIISIDTLKRDIEYRTYLENAYWDIIVIDEAHNVAERGEQTAQRAKLAKLLATRSDSMIMLTATPHDGRAKSFASLMNMLDPTAIADPANYTPEDVKGLFVRRFKNDIKDQVEGTFLERNVETIDCHATVQEENAYRIFAEMSLKMDSDRKQKSGQLFKTSLEKSLFSSPAACIKSIDERLRKLRKKYDDNEFDDIANLEKLKEALEKINSENFSRYTALLTLLKSDKYGWKPNAKDDRLVIFTERIETMKWLAEHLKNDLGLGDKAVVTISGGMSDADQQKTVEDFGRDESPVRVLVASDVASEGINLHYLSHRMIHFDIPWSLMVFQQRNGRIDRYGQQKQPDIRYLVIKSDIERIKGDMRILEVLVAKEKQAMDNIGDPTMLLGMFNVEEEENFTASAIESGKSSEDFEEAIDTANDDFDFSFEAFMAQASEDTPQTSVADDEKTLFTDIDYIESALRIINEKESYAVKRLETVSGLEIKTAPDMLRRLKALMPEEALGNGDYITLSDNKKFIMEKMQESMKNNMEDTAWPQVQYLWKLHPIMTWINDKAGLFFGRNEAPVIGMASGIGNNEIIFIVSGSYPNTKSTPLVDEWFGLCYKNGTFTESISMDEFIRKTGLDKNNIPNTGRITEDDISSASALLPDAVAQAKMILGKAYTEYKQNTDSKIDEELNKLAELEEKHRDYQMSLFTNERKLEEAGRNVDKLFNDFNDYVKDTLTIQDHPYIRVIGAVMGV